MMAGLCHDLGHGPFSHLWESFVREARPGHEWCHEKTSIDMLDYIIQVLLMSRGKQIKISLTKFFQENDLMPILDSYGLTEQDVTFVKVNI